MKTAKFVADTATVAIGIFGFVFEFTATSTIVGRKRFTTAGYIAVALILCIGLLNLELSAVADAAGQRISQEAARKLQEQLTTALTAQAKTVIDQLTPTLNEQKTLVASTTTSLQNSLHKTSVGISSELEVTAEKSTQDLARAVDILEYSDVPLEEFNVRLVIPELSPQVGSGIKPLTGLDKEIDKVMLANIDKRCPPLSNDLGNQKVLTVNPACNPERMSRMFWAWTRPIHKFIDPLNRLQIRMVISFSDLFLTFESKGCSPAQITELCYFRSVSQRFGKRLLNLDKNFHFETNLPPSEIDWISNKTIEPNFIDPGITERDIAFPSLSIEVCDTTESETHKAAEINLASFPSSAQFDVVAMGWPSKADLARLHMQKKLFSDVYHFHRTSMTRRGSNCIDYSYSS